MELFDDVLALNVRATWRLQKAVVQQMLSQEPVNGEYVCLILDLSASIENTVLQARIDREHWIYGLIDWPTFPLISKSPERPSRCLNITEQCCTSTLLQNMRSSV